MEQTASLIRLVLLTLDGQTYALHLEAVDRVLRMVEVTPLPGAARVVEGVVNIEGEVVPVASIRRRLGLARRGVAAGPVTGKADIRGQKTVPTVSSAGPA